MPTEVRVRIMGNSTQPFHAELQHRVVEGRQKKYKCDMLLVQELDSGREQIGQCPSFAVKTGRREKLHLGRVRADSSPERTDHGRVLGGSNTILL